VKYSKVIKDMKDMTSLRFWAMWLWLMTIGCGTLLLGVSAVIRAINT